MLFKIKDIGDDGLEVDLPVTTAWLAEQCPDLGAKPGPGGLKLHGVLEKSGDDVLLRGELRGVLETPCSRCLDPARVDLDARRAVRSHRVNGDRGQSYGCSSSFRSMTRRSR